MINDLRKSIELNSQVLSKLAATDLDAPSEGFHALSLKQSSVSGYEDDMLADSFFGSSGDSGFPTTSASYSSGSQNKEKLPEGNLFKIPKLPLPRGGSPMSSPGRSTATSSSRLSTATSTGRTPKLESITTPKSFPATPVLEKINHPWKSPPITRLKDSQM
jgi:hypothetical protein